MANGLESVGTRPGAFAVVVGDSLLDAGGGGGGGGATTLVVGAGVSDDVEEDERLVVVVAVLEEVDVDVLMGIGGALVASFAVVVFGSLAM